MLAVLLSSIMTMFSPTATMFRLIHHKLQTPSTVQVDRMSTKDPTDCLASPSMCRILDLERLGSRRELAGAMSAAAVAAVGAVDAWLDH